MGDEDEGVEYDSAEAATGKAGSDANGTTITFSTECAAPTIYMGDTASLTIDNGSYTAATITGVSETPGSTDCDLEATFTDNDDTVTAVGFRYQEEGDSSWTEITLGSYTSGSAESQTITGLTSSTDYLYYAFMIANGIEKRSATYAFTTN